jgi:hypothetical protein
VDVNSSLPNHALQIPSFGVVSAESLSPGNHMTDLARGISVTSIQLSFEHDACTYSCFLDKVNADDIIPDVPRIERTGVVLLVAVIVIVSGAAIAALLWLHTTTTLEFKVCDAVSGKWVWGAIMQLQDRTIVGYYQSDAAPAVFRFTHLTPGKAALEIHADNYQPIIVPVTLHRGVNKLEQPIGMIGVRIPDLSRFYIFEETGGADPTAQLRPVDSKGEAVLNHPCMDLWIGCRICAEVKNGLPVSEETQNGASRGEELFRGEIPWTWDPSPEKQYRYLARLPMAIRASPSPFTVIDYLIVEPNPLAISHAELEQLMSRVYALDSLAAVGAALDAEKGRVQYFIETSWNVKARPQ